MCYNIYIGDENMVINNQHKIYILIMF